MTYTPYLIANFATGFTNRLQPWLLADDAQDTLYDGYVYRGVMSKREGYNYFATGLRGGAPYRESRIVSELTAVAPSTGAINGSNKTFVWNATVQIARGSVTVTGSNPAVTGVDDGLGNITGTGIDIGSTVDYLTGVLTVVFVTAPVALSTVLLTYSFMPGNPVMMIAQFVTASTDPVTGVAIRQLIVADTQYVNRYDPTTNTLGDIS